MSTIRPSFTRPAFALALVAVASLAGCSSSSAEGEGAVAFTAWGEEYIEEGIPASAFEDGWAVTYDRFLVAIHDVAIGDEASTVPVARMDAAKVLDLKKPGVKSLVRFDALPGRAYRHVSYRIAPASATSTPVEGATDADRDALATGGFSVYVEGRLEKGAVTKRFRWGFTTDTLYDRCEGELAGKKTEGVVVTNGGTDTPEITVHGDHLFYDDLQSPDAKVRGEHVAAADRDGDGEVTLDELAAVRLVSLPEGRGTYGTGSAAGIHDLRAFVEALSRTVGHFRGEGECFASAR